MNANPIISVHLDQHIGRMICNGHGIILVKVDSDHVAIPADPSAEVLRVELDFGSFRVVLERLIPTIAQV